MSAPSHNPDQNWELLIVENGAQHPEAAAAAIADDPRMSMISIDHSATLAVARNVGIAHTTAELITFIDDDDVWVPERLVRHVAAHRDHPRAPASFSGYWHMDAAGRRFGRDWRSRQAPASDMLRGAVPTPLGPTMMIRRADFVAVGGHSPEIPILEDFEISLRLAMRGDLIYIDETLMGYRRHGFNMTSTAPENVRLRRHAMEDMIKRQRWAATGRNAPRVAALFDERLHRFFRTEAASAGVGVPRQLRRRQFVDARKNILWGLRRAPGAFLTAMAGSFARRLTVASERGADG